MTLFFITHPFSRNLLNPNKMQPIFSSSKHWLKICLDVYFQLGHIFWDVLFWILVNSFTGSESVKFISSTQSSISKSSQSNDKGSSSFIISVAPSQQDQTQATQKAWKTNFTPLVLTSPKEKSAKDQSSSSNAQNRKLKR